MISLVVAVAVSLSSMAAEAVEVRLIDGHRATGTIDHWDAASLRLTTADGPESFQLDRLASLAPLEADAQVAAEAALWVHLADGSILPLRQYTTQQDKASIVLVQGDDLELARADVVAVRFRPASPAMGRPWRELVATHSDADLLVVEKAGSLDYLRGRIEEVTDELVRFELDGDLLPVKRSKLFGLRYYRSAGRQLATPAARLTDSAGAVWTVLTIESNGSQISWTTPLGLERTAPLEQIVRIDFAQANVVYLSDLEPETFRWTPYFKAFGQVPAVARFFQPRNDRSLSAGPITLDGETYQHGLALHSRTTLTYRLDGDFQRFQAVAGIDDSVRPAGHVRLIVRGDDRVLLETSVSGAQRSLPIDLDVSGVRRLTIVVDFGADLDVADHLNLADARLLE